MGQLQNQYMPNFKDFFKIQFGVPKTFGHV